MISHAKPLLHAIEASLSAGIQNSSKLGDLELAFISWIFPKNNPRSVDMNLLEKNAAAASGAQRTYREVATLGLLSVIRPLNGDSQKALIDGIKWIIQRPAYAPNGTPTFEIHGIALLGIALGMKSLNEADKEKAFAWMDGFLPKTAGANLDSFNRAVIAIAASVIGRSKAFPFSSDSLGTCALIVSAENGISESEDRKMAVALDEILSAGLTRDDATAAALKLGALNCIYRSLPRINFKSLAIEDVISVLSGLAHSLKRWTWESASRTGKKGSGPVRWAIENEYHLQNLLWAILSPVFSELDDEENIKSSGPAHPRADLCIRSLELVIEAKYMRGSSQSEQSKMMNELSADAGLYCVPGSGYSRIIAVIWDDSRSTEHHAEMIKGLESVPGIEKAFFVSRPGRMQSLISRAKKSVSKKGAKIVSKSRASASASARQRGRR
ncbi:MAG: hypothetical protein IPJ84_07725 [Bdellovibrionales bacterium]|nr:hypothetical protein [Bdellovibrionales bacterium]